MYVEIKGELFFFIEIVDLQASEDDIKADLLLKIEVEEGKINLIRFQQVATSMELVRKENDTIFMAQLSFLMPCPRDILPNVNIF